MKAYHVIRHDLFDISARIREIDKNYFVVFNYKNKKFEIHNRLQRQDTLCLTLPFDRLDYRAISLVRKTRIERMQQLIDEMERSNQQLEKQSKCDIIKRAEYNAERALSACN